MGSIAGATRGARAEDRLTVLHVTAPGPVGGLESVVRQLAEGHHERGHHVHVAAVLDISQRGVPFVEQLETSGIRVHRITLSGRGYLAERAAIRKICRAVRPDIVHTHGPRPDVLDSGVARRLGIATVTTAHGSSRMGGVTRIHEWLERLAFRRMDAVVAVSAPLAATLEQEGVPSGRVHTVLNAWRPSVPFQAPEDARRTLGINGDAYHIGWIGRLIPAKGGDVFLRALAGVRDIPFIASVIGDGPERPALEQLARDGAIADRVRFHGTQLNAAAVCRAFDLLVMSSRTEGTPVVLLEAMAAGVPTVVTAVGGIPDIVSAHESILVEPESPDALAAAIREAATHAPASRRRAENAARHLREHLDEETWLDRYEDVYRAVRRRTN